ncbi:thermonuclease family protein [Peribacillus asahii]|uniref:thermonuclease family protein n=1 Tax=Peribacillus asahii TaxID=228899 RepID=UPI003815E522
MLQSYFKYILLACMSILLLTACSETETIENKTENATAQQTNSTNKEETVQEKKGSTFTAEIVKVVDGDTMKIKLPNGNEETVRLLLIDTPETVHPSKDVQPFGPEASQFSKELMPPGSKVEVETGISERDKYGRLLAYFYVDGKMVNKMLLEKGLARVAYVYAPNTKYLDELEAVQKEAQKKAIGIWSIENYVTSKGFNDSIADTKDKTQKEPTVNEQTCANPTIKGNINSKGDKIYHLPSGAHYDVTKAEEMFCTEEEAKAAGFRPSQR